MDTFPETDSEEYDNVDVSLQFTHEDEDYAVKKVEGKTYTRKQFDDAKWAIEREKPRHEVRRETLEKIDKLD